MSKIQENALVVEQQMLARQTYRLRLESPRIAGAALAGQFTMLRVGNGLDPLLRRPFSFHRVFPRDGVMEILYRVVGRGTWQLSQYRPGTALDLMGPLGNAFDIPREDAGPIVLVAGGIGIAPLFELIGRLAADGVQDPSTGIHLFYGARTAAELLPPESFSDLGISVHWSTDDGSFGYRGYVTRLFQQFLEARAIRPAVVYACGPLAMQYRVAKWALLHRIPSQLSLESLMACGVGACLGCALPAPVPGDPSSDRYVHVCKDGPIFSAGSIQWHKIQLQPAPPPMFPYS